MLVGPLATATGDSRHLPKHHPRAEGRSEAPRCVHHLVDRPVTSPPAHQATGVPCQCCRFRAGPTRECCVRLLSLRGGLQPLGESGEAECPAIRP